MKHYKPCPFVQISFEASPDGCLYEPRDVIARLFRRYRKNPRVSISRMGNGQYRAAFVGCARGVIYRTK
jgi:hypothetical protein